MSDNIVGLDDQIMQSKVMHSFSKNLMEYFLKNDTYIFSPILIDNINIYIIIYNKEKIVTFESALTSCVVQIDKKKINQKYVLHYFQYSSVFEALQTIYYVQNNYKLYNGILIDSQSYKLKKIEDSLNHHKDDEICSICLDHTTQQTNCNHSICFSCREKCINMDKPDCPMCRNDDALSYVKLEIGISYNDHIKVKKALSKFNFYYNFSDENDYIPPIPPVRNENQNQNTNTNYIQIRRNIIEEGEIIEENEENQENEIIENQENQENLGNNSRKNNGLINHIIRSSVNDHHRV